jgi:hypothetical protein
MMGAAGTEVDRSLVERRMARRMAELSLWSRADAAPSPAALRALADDRWRAAWLSLREHRFAGAARHAAGALCADIELYGCWAGEETTLF